MTAWPTIRELAAELADDRLDGAACTARAPLFDAVVDGEDDDDRLYRLIAAARICHDCPVLVACNRIARELGADAIGVWAGRARGMPRAPGRPRRGVA
ncbi:WhiB family transcriptional regulator [Nocardia sp. MW-W600-9]